MIWAHHAGLAVGLFCSTGGADSSSFQEPEFYQSSERNYCGGFFQGGVYFFIFLFFTSQCVTIKECVWIWIMICTGAESKGKGFLECKQTLWAVHALTPHRFVNVPYSCFCCLFCPIFLTHLYGILPVVVTVQWKWKGLVKRGFVL